MALTASVTIFAAGMEFSNPYMPLFAFPLLLFARIEIGRIHYAVQRIAADIRVVLGQEGKIPQWYVLVYSAGNARLPYTNLIIRPLKHVEGTGVNCGSGSARDNRRSVAPKTLSHDQSESW